MPLIKVQSQTQILYLQRLVISELKQKGLPLYFYLDKTAELSKKLSINHSIHQYDWDDYKKEFEIKQKKRAVQDPELNHFSNATIEGEMIIPKVLVLML